MGCRTQTPADSAMAPMEKGNHASSPSRSEGKSNSTDVEALRQQLCGDCDNSRIQRPNEEAKK